MRIGALLQNDSIFLTVNLERIPDLETQLFDEQSLVKGDAAALADGPEVGSLDQHGRLGGVFLPTPNNGTVFRRRYQPGGIVLIEIHPWNFAQLHQSSQVEVLHLTLNLIPKSFWTDSKDRPLRISFTTSLGSMFLYSTCISLSFLSTKTRHLRSVPNNRPSKSATQRSSPPEPQERRLKPVHPVPSSETPRATSWVRKGRFSHNMVWKRKEPLSGSQPRPLTRAISLTELLCFPQAFSD